MKNHASGVDYSNRKNHPTNNTDQKSCYMQKTLKIYWAGDLFDHKDLIGNLLLAEAVEKLSHGRYQIMLPQDGECEVCCRTSHTIRNADFLLLYDCDVLVANFDGHDLDSGTVVEFCFAKMVDMPAVLLRTDFRFSGDGTLPDGEPWNLMCSHYPRTRVKHINSMMRYHDIKKQAAGSDDFIRHYMDSIAVEIIKALDEVIQEPSWLSADLLPQQYRMALKSIGGGIEELIDSEKLQSIIQSKLSSGLY